MASLSSCSVRDRDYQSGAETVDVDTYQALTVCILALVVCKSLFRVNAVRGKVDCLSGGAPMALEIERLFLNAETAAKRCLERTVTSAETQDRKKSGNRPAQSRQKVRFLIGAVWAVLVRPVVGATGIEPIFSPKSHPADLPKTVL